VLRPRAAHPDAFHIICVIHEVGDELMLIEAAVNYTGKLLTISIPERLLPVCLIVDPPGGTGLVQLLANYAERAKNVALE
jgi:hypothetical protein